MTIHTSLLQMSGCNPYHSQYNPDALDDYDPENERFPMGRYFILNLDDTLIQDAIHFTDKVNTAYREITQSEDDYCDLTGFLQQYIRSEGSDLQDIHDEMIEQFEEGDE